MSPRHRTRIADPVPSDDKWLINDVGFDDIKHRILARPETGDTEVWSLENHSDDWDHPVSVSIQRKERHGTVQG